MSKNFVEYIIGVRDNATQVVTKLNTTFETARVNAAKFQAVASKLPLTINDLKGEISALENKRGFAKTREDIIKVNTVLKQTHRELNKLENLPPQGFISKMNQMVQTITGFSLKDIGIAYFAAETFQFIKGSTALWDESAKSQAQLRQSIISTGGAAGKTFNELTDAASAMQDKTLFDDDAVAKAQSILLTFTNIKGVVFDQAMPAIADLATKMGTDLNSAVLQVGKALNEPAEGFTALKRAGIQFSDEQEKQIKKLVAQGDIQAAQFIMLNELQRQFGGSAEAAAKVGLGPVQQLANSWGDFREIVGKLTLNLVNSVLPVFKNLVGWLNKNEEIIKIIGKVVLAAGAAFLVYKGVMLASTLITKIMTIAALKETAVTFARTLATQGLTKAMLVLNGVSKANMFAALASVAIAAVTAFQLFRKKTDEATEAVENAKQVGQDYYAKEKMNLDLIFEKLKRTNPMSKERNKLVDELKQMYPDLNKQILDEIRNTNNLATAYDVIIGKIKARAMVKSKEAALESIYSQMGDTYSKIDEIATKLFNSQSGADFAPTNDQDYENYKNSGFFYGQKKPMTEAEIRTKVDNILSTNGKIQIQDKQGAWINYENKDAVALKQEEQKILKQLVDLQFGGSGASSTTGAGGGTGGDTSGSGTTPSKAIDSITGGGKSMKQIYINIDNLVGVNNNHFNPDQDPADATSFMEKLTNALQMIVNDTNYATN